MLNEGVVDQLREEVEGVDGFVSGSFVEQELSYF
jgi:hypothetical protein